MNRNSAPINTPFAGLQVSAGHVVDQRRSSARLFPDDVAQMLIPLVKQQAQSIEAHLQHNPDDGAAVDALYLLENGDSENNAKMFDPAGGWQGVESVCQLIQSIKAIIGCYTLKDGNHLILAEVPRGWKAVSDVIAASSLEKIPLPVEAGGNGERNLLSCTQVARVGSYRLPNSEKEYPVYGGVLMCQEMGVSRPLPNVVSFVVNKERDTLIGWTGGQWTHNLSPTHRSALIKIID